jgi:penicillin G amidase
VFPGGAARAAGVGAALAGVAGAAAGAAWHRLFLRPLPRTRGRLVVRGLEGPVDIGRDRFGVPRIEARTIADAVFGQGFCHGQDRLFQLDLYRRFALGRVAEFGGPPALDVDVLMRTLGMRRAAARDLDRLPGEERRLLEAYAAGVNAAAEAAPARPLELQLLRLGFEPWTALDSLATGKLLALGFSTNMESELFRAELIKRVGPERAQRLEPSYPEGNPVVVDGSWPGDPLTVARQLDAVREAIGLGVQPAGSNNWVVSGERSATGRPLLAGDPHITTSIPDVWYQVELGWPGGALRGGSMPTLPGIVIGQSRHVAWSFTNAMADVQDLFVERIDGDRYEFEGERLPLRLHREEIGVKGRREPEPLQVQETHHGPILTGPLGAEGEQPLALAWTALREPTWRALGVTAGELETGAELVERFADYAVPAMNMLWADSGGNIGYKLVGKLPRRRSAVADLPKPGWTGEHEWDGYAPYEELPSFVNPPGGTLVTANNRIAADGFPHHITSEYLDGYRAARIEALLAERPRHTLDDFERIQTDLESIPGAETARRLTALEPRDDRQREALDELAAWDHRLDPETEAGSLYQAFTVHFARLASEAAIGDAGYAERWRSKSQLGFTDMNSAPWRWQARLLELWEEGDPELIEGRDWDELALDALDAALDDLESRRDRRWGVVHGLRFPHPLGRGSPVLDRLLSRRVRAGGGQETVCQIGFVPHAGDYTGTWAPSYRLLADLGDPDRSRWQHMTGQSGHPGSRHYDDLLEDWLAGRTNPVRQPAVDTLHLDPA